MELVKAPIHRRPPRSTHPAEDLVRRYPPPPRCRPSVEDDLSGNFEDAVREADAVADRRFDKAEAAGSLSTARNWPATSPIVRCAGKFSAPNIRNATSSVNFAAIFLDENTPVAYP